MVPVSMNTDVIRTERPATNSRIFAHTRWDAIPVAAGLFHLAYFLGMFFLYPHAPLWVMLILGFLYSLMVKSRTGGIRDHALDHVRLQLAIRDLLYGAVLVSRTLLQLFERLLSPLRRESRQTDRLGREQLRQNLQLALFL